MSAVEVRPMSSHFDVLQSPSKFLLNGISHDAFKEKYAFVIECFNRMEVGSMMRDAAQHVMSQQTRSDAPIDFKKTFESLSGKEAEFEAFKILFDKCRTFASYPINEDGKFSLSNARTQRMSKVFEFACSRQEEQNQELMSTFSKNPSLVIRVGMAYYNAVFKKNALNAKYSDLVKEFCPQDKLYYTYWNNSANLDVDAQMKALEESADFAKSFQLASQMLHHYMLKRPDESAKFTEEQVQNLQKAFDLALAKCPDEDKKSLVSDLIHTDIDYLIENTSSYVSTLATYNCTTSYLRSWTPF